MPTRARTKPTPAADATNTSALLGVLHLQPCSPLLPLPDAANIAAYLAQRVWAWIDGDISGTLLFLQRLGCVILSRPEPGRTWFLQGIAGTNAALCRNVDPLAVAQALGYLLGGMLWPQAFPGFLKLVTAEWGRRTQAAKGTARKEER